MVPDAPEPGSHDRSTPTGTIEQSAADLFEAMLRARDADEGEAGRTALQAFYRALMSATLILPVPPDHGEEARAALASAITDDAEVEISVMLAQGGDGQPMSVCFGSIAALSAWSPRGTASLPIPARIAIANLAAADLPAIMDPAGPIPYRFEPDELAALAAGRLPGSDAPLWETPPARSLRLRRPGSEVLQLEAALRDTLRETEVEAAWLVASDSRGEHRLLLGLLGDKDATAAVEVPDGTDVVWLEEPLLTSIRAVAEPFFRREA